MGLTKEEIDRRIRANIEKIKERQHNEEHHKDTIYFKEKARIAKQSERKAAIAEARGQTAAPATQNIFSRIVNNPTIKKVRAHMATIQPPNSGGGFGGGASFGSFDPPQFQDPFVSSSKGSPKREKKKGRSRSTARSDPWNFNPF